MSIEKLVGCENHVLPPKSRPYEVCRTCSPYQRNVDCAYYVPLTVQQTQVLVGGERRVIYALVPPGGKGE